MEYSPATEQLLILLVALLFPPVTVLIILILLLATFGRSLGIRRAYVDVLLATFEWASKRIEKSKTKVDIDPDISDIGGEDKVTTSFVNGISNGALTLRKRSSSAKNLIVKDETSIMRRKITSENYSGAKNALSLFGDSLDFMKVGIESIIEDEVTMRFTAEELTSWNLLSRTSYGYQYVSLRLTIIWCLGFIFRYAVLLPFRLIILSVGLTFLVVATAFIGYVPDGEIKRYLNWHISVMCYRVLARAVSVIATFHNRENSAKGGGICVANHTSPIDVLILAQDNCYALVGQKHGGLLGLIQRSLSRASSHIWFDRSELEDRSAVSRKLRSHAEDSTKLPILIFPEGTCINNTSVMMFKKGSFEIGATVYPVAVKYDPRFGDAFWNSSLQTYFQYIIMMMTSWAIVVDVWYLPPMTRLESESAIQFANRVKREIAAAGGLVDLDWDGQLKRYPVKKEMLEKQRENYSKRLQFTSPNGATKD
uniref:Phospholipid/glycerol acyltransferase domain-containing protein n=1 Tax=Romanomermis culicivorax TaxID=13658 RepID=A0A915JYW3_ROMCU